MSASQCSFNAHLKTKLKFKNLRGRLKKDFAFETETYSKKYLIRFAIVLILKTHLPKFRKRIAVTFFAFEH